MVRPSRRKVNYHETTDSSPSDSDNETEYVPPARPKKLKRREDSPQPGPSGIQISAGNVPEPETDDSESDQAQDQGTGVDTTDYTTESTEPESDTESFVITPHEHKIKWKHRDLEPIVHKFKGIPGIKVDLDDQSRPLDIFKSFFNDELLELVVEETNRYVHQKGAPDRGRKSSVWKDVSKEEMQSLFALMILMGIVRKPSLEDFWDTDELIETPKFATVMPRDRFFAIYQSLHFCDSETADEEDRLHKIRQVVELLNTNFREVMTPEKDVSTDESLLKFKGRLSWRQFNPSKRARFGFKVYKTCQSGGSAPGYIWNFSIYTAEDAKREGLASSSIVLQLNQNLLHKGYNLYLDNWYSSPDLFIDLFRAKTNVCGTVQMKRRLMPKDLPKDKDMKRGEVAYRASKKGLLMMLWKDKKVVRLLTTMHSADMVATGRVNRHTQEPIVKPQIVLDYNIGMGGVDHSDALATTYEVARKTVKWYRKLFFYLFDMCLTNSWLIYRKLGGKVTHVNFRKQLVREMLSDADLPEYPRSGRRRTRTTATTRKSKHMPTRVPAVGKRKRGMRRCVYCRKVDGKRSNTGTLCSTCNVPLCWPECYAKFHE